MNQENWQWFGHAGHLIVAQWCRFHLCTKVGDYLVSTVGEYVPEESSREIHCQVRGVQLEGRGDARLADFINKVGFVEIGFGRTYETMIFRAGQPCTRPDCNCGIPEIDGSELWMDGYTNAGAATAGHVAACERAQSGNFDYEDSAEESK